METAPLFSLILVPPISEIHAIRILCRSQDSITAIPLEQWKLDYIVPSILCTTKDNKCIPSSYPTPKEAVKVDVDGDDADTGPLPPNIVDPAVKLKYLQGGVSKYGESPGDGQLSVACSLSFLPPHHASLESRSEEDASA